jgi:tetratricopeptide (TPR) repeat protein
MIELVNIYDKEWVFNDELIDFSVHEKLDQAIDYWESGNPEPAIIILKSILSENLYHIDAYHHLSLIYEECKMEFEAYLCCREAVRIGLSVIPNKFSWKTSQLMWWNLDNRPFFRAYHNLGLWLERRNEKEEVINIFSNMLSVCPNDNLGVRYMLPRLWLEKGDVLSVIRLCKKYRDDYSAETMYTYPLALIMSGEIKKAKPLLVYAKSSFPLVAEELVKNRHQKPEGSIYGGIIVGGAEEAYEYWKDYGKYWLDCGQAMELISEV